MPRPRKAFRAAKVSRARARIAAGDDGSSEVLDLSIDLMIDLDLCPIGNGNAYRRAVTKLLTSCLSEVVDETAVKEEFPCNGGRGDIDLPLRLERLRDYPLWDTWKDWYGASSVIVEVKNTGRGAKYEDVGQLESYLEHAGRGGLGFLVSRNGFSASASKAMTKIAKDREKLILPITHGDLSKIVAARKMGPVAVMEVLRRRYSLLLQNAS